MEGLIFHHYHDEIPTPLHRFSFAYYSMKQSRHVLDEIKRSSSTLQYNDTMKNMRFFFLVEE